MRGCTRDEEGIGANHTPSSDDVVPLHMGEWAQIRARVIY